MQSKEIKNERKRQMKLLKEQYNQMIIAEEERRKLPKVAPEGVYVSLQNVNKVYDNFVQAVYDFNLDIQEHELIVFVGPSGCGKSTTLRMIAGLESITTGDLYIDGVWCNEKTPRERDVAMVFQNYALYPHMTVYENLAFGLETRGFDKKEIDRRVKKAAEILQITEYLDRRPKQLSGGQMQRVALGRAIVREAKVFLMDEPLSNLDAKLRVSMRSEIIKLHKSINATTIYVTHDQTEAMTMATRIVVMEKGVVKQIGAPEDVYNHPADTFVATFIGAPAMNLISARYENGKVVLPGGFEIALTDEQKTLHDEFYKKQMELVDKRIENKEYEKPDIGVLLSLNNKKKTLKDIVIDLFKKKKDEPVIKTPEEKLAELEAEKAGYEECLAGAHDVIFGIRPEDIHELEEVPTSCVQSNSMTLKVSLAELLGGEYHVHLDMDDVDLIAKCRAIKKVQENSEFTFVFDLNKMHVFDEANKKSIL